MGIKRKELEDKLLFSVFTAFCVALMHGKATYCHVLSGLVRQIKVSCYRLRCIFAISEHWLYESNLHELSSIHPQFNFHAISGCDRVDDFMCKWGYGGVAIFWRKSIDN